MFAQFLKENSEPKKASTLWLWCIWSHPFLSWESSYWE